MVDSFPRSADGLIRAGTKPIAVQMGEYLMLLFAGTLAPARNRTKPLLVNNTGW